MVYEQLERHIPDIALIAADFPGMHALELAMFLRGSSATCSLGWLGAANESEADLLSHLRVEQLPAMGSDDISAIVRAVRQARRHKRLRSSG